MPAVKSAGKTSNVLSDAPLTACVADMPKSATSVAVSKPSPNRKPDREEVPALAHEFEQRAEETREKPTIVEQEIEVVVRERLAAFDRLERPPNRDQDDDVEGRQQKQEERGHACAHDAADRFPFLEPRVHL